ncbi:hypothetical protein PMNALOAF_0445 [Methylobacterium adhaesivum]|nr:hypothetical protein PMNALOAF_0445 [Methylobacterium adhaesivum]
MDGRGRHRPLVRRVPDPGLLCLHGCPHRPGFDLGGWLLLRHGGADLAGANRTPGVPLSGRDPPFGLRADLRRAYSRCDPGPLPDRRWRSPAHAHPRHSGLPRHADDRGPRLRPDGLDQGAGRTPPAQGRRPGSTHGHRQPAGLRGRSRGGPEPAAPERGAAAVRSRSFQAHQRLLRSCRRRRCPGRILSRGRCPDAAGNDLRPHGRGGVRLPVHGPRGCACPGRHDPPGHRLPHRSGVAQAERQRQHRSRDDASLRARPRRSHEGGRRGPLRRQAERPEPGGLRPPRLEGSALRRGPIRCGPSRSRKPRRHPSPRSGRSRPPRGSIPTDAGSRPSRAGHRPSRSGVERRRWP